MANTTKMTNPIIASRLSGLICACFFLVVVFLRGLLRLMHNSLSACPLRLRLAAATSILCGRYSIIIGEECGKAAKKRPTIAEKRKKVLPLARLLASTSAGRTGNRPCERKLEFKGKKRSLGCNARQDTSPPVCQSIAPAMMALGRRLSCKQLTIMYNRAVQFSKSAAHIRTARTCRTAEARKLVSRLCLPLREFLSIF